MNSSEQKLWNALADLNAKGKWIGLTWFAVDESCLINEGRDGLFLAISEKFYDRMVEEFDSRQRVANECRADKIEKISDVLNETGAYKKLIELFGGEVSDEIFQDIENFIFEKFTERN